MPASLSISFGGLTGIAGLVMPFSRGVTPSVGTIFLRPRDGLDQEPATLSFSLGGGEVALQGCALGACFVRNGARPYMACQVFDRRWQWKFKSVSGTFNKRLTSGIVDQFTRKQPGELATHILNAMGEFGFDVSRMPTGVYPPADWNASRADLALAKLCEYVACEVVLNPFTNNVEIWPLGTGQDIQLTGDESTPKWRYIPRANIPSQIQVHCGESLYQYRLKLEAIGRGTNLVQTRNPDWLAGLNTATQGLEFPGVSTQLQSALALDTGWREYRVASQEGGNLNVPGVPVPIGNTRQYALKDYILYSVYDDRTQRYQKLPYYIEGDFWPYGDLATSTSNQVYIGQSELYPERQIVKFPFPMVKLDATGFITSPTLYLHVAYAVQDENGSRWRWTSTANVGGTGGTLVLRRPEIQATYGWTGDNTQAQAAAESEKYAQLFQQRFANSYASELTFRGIGGASLDGKVCQIVWKMLPGRIPTTKISEVEEHDQYSVGRQERRRRERLEEV